MDPTDFDAFVYSEQEQAWLAFKSPVHHISTADLSEVKSSLELIEFLCESEKLFAVGYISYEAYRAFDQYNSHITLSNDLLLDMFLFSGYTKFQTLPKTDLSEQGYSLSAWRSSVSADKYVSSIKSIKSEISKGYTYQVNYTFRMRDQFSGDPYSLFTQLINAQGNGYSVFLKTKDLTICSASPELFFKKQAHHIECKPMKGTLRRGRTLTEDLENKERLHASIKDRAENIMIVDMIRNDLGRIATIGSVQVSDLFRIETYPTLLQMTTKVTAETEATISQIFEALFPCASITGAPKISTINIIDRLETTPRGIYTGSIGYITPDLDCQFNVAIRTAVIDNKTGQLTYGVGGGVVWDSTNDGEYEEAFLKADVITKRHPDFSLKESLLWEPENGYYLLHRHLDRLTDSAALFNFKFERKRIIDALLEHTRDKISSTNDHKVRLLLDRNGDFQITKTAISTATMIHTLLRFADQRVDPTQTMIYHKSTIRDNDPLLPKDPLKEDILYINIYGNITETSIANIAVSIDGDLYTPPVSAGLLAGTYRNELIALGKLIERDIHFEELSSASEIYLLNSVRRMWRATLLLE